MRDINLKSAYVRNAFERVSLGNLTISSSAYAANDYLHTGVISLQCFPETTDSYITLERITLREHITSGSLCKPSLRLLFFTTNDMSITANDPFDLTDGSATTQYDIEYDTTINTSMWKNVPGSTTDAYVINNFSTSIPIKNLSSNKTLYLIILVDGTHTFDATATVNGELYIKFN